jgi:hypothetical protein
MRGSFRQYRALNHSSLLLRSPSLPFIPNSTLFLSSSSANSMATAVSHSNSTTSKERLGKEPSSNDHQPPSIILQPSMTSVKVGDAVGRRFFVNPLRSDMPINYDPIVVGPRWILKNKVASILFYPYIAFLRFMALRKAGGNSIFIDNTVRTARYTVFSFFPAQIIQQFSKFANVYFLVVSMIQVCYLFLFYI